MSFRTFADLRSIYRDDARQAYLDFVERRSGEHICAFALGTDDELMGVTPCGDTLEQRAQRLAKWPPRNSAEQKCHEWAFGWNTGEWESIYTRELPCKHPSRVGPKEMLEGMLAFRRQWRQSGRSARSFRRNVLRAMVDALTDLDNERLFGSGPAREKVTIFVEITDSYDSEVVKLATARMLNPRASAQRLAHSLPVTGRMLVKGLALLGWLRRGKLIAWRAAR